MVRLHGMRLIAARGSIFVRAEQRNDYGRAVGLRVLRAIFSDRSIDAEICADGRIRADVWLPVESFRQAAAGPSHGKRSEPRTLLCHDAMASPNGRRADFGSGLRHGPLHADRARNRRRSFLL